MRLKILIAIPLLLTLFSDKSYTSNTDRVEPELGSYASNPSQLILTIVEPYCPNTDFLNLSSVNKELRERFIVAPRFINREIFINLTGTDNDFNDKDHVLDFLLEKDSRIPISLRGQIDNPDLLKKINNKARTLAIFNLQFLEDLSFSDQKGNYKLIYALSKAQPTFYYFLPSLKTWRNALEEKHEPTSEDLLILAHMRSSGIGGAKDPLTAQTSFLGITKNPSAPDTIKALASYYLITLQYELSSEEDDSVELYDAFTLLKDNPFLPQEFRERCMIHLANIEGWGLIEEQDIEAAVNTLIYIINTSRSFEMKYLSSLYLTILIEKVALIAEEDDA